MPTSPAEHIEMFAADPVRTEGAASWYVRTQHLVAGYTVAETGASLTMDESEHEYIVVLVRGRISVESDHGDGTAAGRAQVIVPPGRSRVTAEEESILVRVFAPPPADLAALCLNRDSYREPHHNVAEFAPWPDPVGGYALRVYEYDALPESARIFRTRNIMVNWGGVFAPPRNPSQLSPHAHDDFEQLSLCISGEYIHHIRYPWDPDSTQWLEDEHRQIATPSATIMPPPAIHTSQGIGEGNSLIDIFAPPRLDFSRAGRVYDENAQVYPLPPGRETA